MLVAGGAGLVAGAISMAAGEYVSVSSQSDTERADLNREQAELERQPELEKIELAAIYVARGLTPELAREVAQQLMAKDAPALMPATSWASRDPGGAPDPGRVRFRGAFVVGAALPLLAAAVSPVAIVVPVVVGSTLVVLAALGALAAIVGARRRRSARCASCFGEPMAMGITAAVGALFRVPM